MPKVPNRCDLRLFYTWMGFKVGGILLIPSPDVCPVPIDDNHQEADEGQHERYVDGGHAEHGALVDDVGLQRWQHRAA